MKRLLLPLALLAGCGTFGPVQGGSQAIHDLGSQALAQLIVYAEQQGWTKEQLRAAVAAADVALDDAATTSVKNSENATAVGPGSVGVGSSPQPAPPRQTTRTMAKIESRRVIAASRC